jgi:hypothetical protein
MVCGISGGTEIAETFIEVLYKAHRSGRERERKTRNYGESQQK